MCVQLLNFQPDPRGVKNLDFRMSRPSELGVILAKSRVRRYFEKLKSTMVTIVTISVDLQLSPKPLVSEWVKAYKPYFGSIRGGEANPIVTIKLEHKRKSITMLGRGHAQFKNCLSGQQCANVLVGTSVLTGGIHSCNEQPLHHCEFTLALLHAH